MRLFIAVLFACLLVPVAVEARPSPYPVDRFDGDRYVAPIAQPKARAVTQRAAPVRYSQKARYYDRVKKTAPRGNYRRPAKPYVPPTLAQGLARAVAQVVGGRPAGCPARSWCGCWLASHLGIRDRSLWLARNWARVGTDAGGPRPGAIVVWRHHVGKITAVSGNRILVISGNDSRAVRHRWRAIGRAIAYRMVG